MNTNKEEALQLQMEQMKKLFDEQSAALSLTKREVAIEVALEKVRARTMTMQRSDELPDAANILFQQVESLGMPAWSAGYCTWDVDKNAITLWMSSAGIIQQPFKAPVSEDPVFIHFYEAWQKGETFYVEEMGGDKLVSHYKYMCRLPVVGEMLNKFVGEGGSLPVFQIFHLAFFQQGFLLFITYEQVPEAHDIFKRFGKVFEQTYTRFLDLQKAEAQLREAKIEAALERTRTQSMMMQHSKELDDTLRVFHEQVLLLGIKSSFSFLWLPDEEKDRHIFWAAWAEDQASENVVKNGAVIFKSKAINYPLDRNEPATAQCLIDWKSNEPVYSYAVPPEGVENYFAAWKELIEGVKKLTPEHFAGGLYYVEAFMKYGCFGVMVTNDLKEEEKKILGRFAIEFERTYRRFLDLQKAEAQARESQIQLALERVRARTMAMQRSDELAEVATILFQQVKALGVSQWACGFNIWEIGDKDYTFYPGNPDGNVLAPCKVPLTEHWVFSKMDESRKRGEEFYMYEKEGEKQEEHYRYMLSVPGGLGDLLQNMLNAGMQVPTFQIDHFANFSHGNLMFITYEHFPEMHDIFKRFAKVFEQTYTRFLDLQKAEAQAREAQIEAALERVRSRSMGMQKSEELKEVIKIVYQQLIHLKINLDHAGFVVNYTPKGDWHFWIADEQDIPSTITHPYFESVWANQFNEAKEKAADFFATHLNFEEKNKFYNELLSYVPGLPEASKDFYLNCPGLAASTVLFDNVSLYIENFFGTPYTDEENTTLKRFGKVFQQTYTRFLDLQKAEAQAREAHIEAALERVRGKTMAMHISTELQNVIMEMASQLEYLGFRFDSVNIDVNLEIHKDPNMHLWISVSGKQPYPTKVVIPYFDHPIFIKGYERLNKGENFFVDAFSKEEKDTFFNHVFQNTILKYIPEERKQYIYKGKGMARSVAIAKHTALAIYNYDVNPYTVEQNSILVRFSYVFDQAYTRFLDLQKAEAQTRESQVQLALERVRARTMAMQKSDELVETAAVLFQQLILLGIEPNRLYISIVKDENGSSEFWITDEDGTKISTAFSANLNDNRSFAKMFEGWKQQKSCLEIDMQGEELQNYFRHLTSLGVPFKGGLAHKRRVQDIAYFNKGFIGIASPDEQPQETIVLLERFASVFNLTFTRFNDLKIAEAHAVQAEEDLIKLQTEKKRAEDALVELRAAQKQLVQSEKMASLGELTAGIAHEIQNPLNFVNNFSEVSKELLDEMRMELDAGNTADALSIANDIIQNLEKINHHGKRADAIVKGMLQHSQTSTGQKEPTDINKLAEEYLRLAYYGLKAKDKSFNASLKTEYDESIGNINIIPQDIGRVLLNLYNNAFYAVNEKKKSQSEGYEPTVVINTKKVGDKISISVKDKGNGIPQKIVDKIFQPFFTTKPTGQGTGLGLSLSYDIIKAHGGEIKVETKEGEGTVFIVILLLNQHT